MPWVTQVSVSGSLNIFFNTLVSHHISFQCGGVVSGLRTPNFRDVLVQTPDAHRATIEWNLRAGELSAWKTPSPQGGLTGHLGTMEMKKMVDNMQCTWAQSRERYAGKDKTPLYYSMQGFPVLHYLPEFAQTYVHWIGNTIQPSLSAIPFSSCPLSFPASGSFPKSQLFSTGDQSIEASASASELPVSI